MTTTENTNLGFFERIKESFKGILLGLVLIPISFIVVYYASQREQASEVLNKAVPIEELAKAKEKQLPIYINGKLKLEPTTDNLYLKPAPYLVITRKTEMYAYMSKSTTKDNKTTYTCELEWTSMPENSAEGEGCRKENKTNPTKKIADFYQSYNPNLIRNDQTFQINGRVRYIDMPTKTINSNDLTENLITDGKYFYVKESCLKNPEVGCERFNYNITTYDENKTYTVIGSVDTNIINEYKSKEGNHYLVIGEGNYQDVLKSLGSQDTRGTWFLFGLSVFLFGLGLILLINPFLELIEMIPLIGGFGAGMIRFIIFFFAFIVMGISFLLIEYWYIILILGVLGVIFLIYWSINRSKKTT